MDFHTEVQNVWTITAIRGKSQNSRLPSKLREFVILVKL